MRQFKRFIYGKRETLMIVILSSILIYQNIHPQHRTLDFKLVKLPSLCVTKEVQLIYLEPDCKLKELELFGEKHMLNTGSEHISEYVTKSEHDNYKWMIGKCKPTMQFIDIGCNYGVYSKLMKEKCGCEIVSIDIYIHHLMATKCVVNTTLIWGAIGQKIPFQEYVIPRVYIQDVLKMDKTPLIKIDIEHSEQLIYQELKDIIEMFDEVHIIAEYTPLWWVNDKGVESDIQTGTFEVFMGFIMSVPGYCHINEVKTGKSLQGLARDQIRQISGDQSDMTIDCVKPYLINLS